MKRKTTARRSNPRYLISRDGVEVGIYPGFTSVEAVKRAKAQYGPGKYVAEKISAEMYLGRGGEEIAASERLERQKQYHAERLEKVRKGKQKNPGMPVAETILAQLGGNRFVTMTGARNFVGSSNKLQFKIPKNQSSANFVTIELTPDDLYTVTFAKYRGLKVTTLKEFDGVYADQLRSIFERYTGLYTSLGTMSYKPNGKRRNGTHIHAKVIDHLDVAKVHNPAEPLPTLVKFVNTIFDQKGNRVKPYTFALVQPSGSRKWEPISILDAERLLDAGQAEVYYDNRPLTQRYSTRAQYIKAADYPERSRMINPDDDEDEEEIVERRYKFITIPDPNGGDDYIYPIETEDEIHEAQEAMQHAGINYARVFIDDHGTIVQTSLMLWQD